MSKYNEFLQSIGIEPGLIISGFFAVLASIKRILNKGFWAAFAHVFTGIGSSIYATPVIIEILEKINLAPKNTYGIGFVCGYTGSEAILLIYNKFIKKNIV